MKKILFLSMVLALSLMLVTAVPVGAPPAPGASTAPTANVSLGQTNALVMDFTISDGGDSLIAGIAPSAGTATVNGEDADWAIDSYDKTAENMNLWDNVDDLLAIDDDADNDYTAQADTTLAGVAPSAGTSLVTAAIAAWQGVTTAGTVSYYDKTDTDAWDSVNDAIWLEGTGDDQYTAADTLLAGTAPPDPTAETGDGGKDSDWTTINLYEAVGANAWDALVDGIIEDFHAGGTYSAAADTYVAGAVPADGTSYTWDNAFVADWGMDSYDAVEDAGAWNSGADAIIIDADTNNAYLDQLNAITLKNTGSAADTSDISAVKVWAEDGTTAGFQAGEDTLLGSATWDTTDSWDLSALTTDIPATDQRVYVTVDIAAAADVGDTIIMQVPTLDDSGATPDAYDAGEEGLFFASTYDTGNITNANTQTITAGAIDHYAVSAIGSPQVSGTAFNVTIQAQDQSNNDITTGGDAAETVNITLGQVDAGATPTATTTANGTVTVGMTMTVAQAGQSITFTGATSGKIGTSNSFDVTSPPTPTVSRRGPTIKAKLFGEVFYLRTTTKGETRETIEATSEDGNLTITIPRGTIALDEDDNSLRTLKAEFYESPPDPPEDAHIIGLAYDLGPDGATFDPEITLGYTYDPDDLPEGVNEEDLVLAYYNEDIGEWVELDTTVDPVTNTIIAEVDHFTVFTIIAPAAAPAPVASPPVLAPAAFTSSSLSISPLEVDVGETVTIGIMVSNTGEEEGSYTITLKINGVAEETKEITLAGGASETVTFTTARDKAGIYSVDVDGLTDSFTVKEEEEAAPATAPPPTAPPEAKPEMNWPVLGGIIGGVIVVGLLIFFLIRRKMKAA